MNTPDTPALEALSAAGLAAAWLDPQLNVVTCTEQFERLLHRAQSDEGDIPWHFLGAFDQVSPEISLPLRAPESRRLHIDEGGLRRTFHLKLTPQQGCVLAILTDLTEAESLVKDERHLDTLSVMGRFAAQIAHELNNMLVVISGRGQLLQMGLPPSPRLQEDIREILLAGNRAQHLAKRLMLLRPTARQDPAVICVDEAVESSFKLMSRLLPHGAELKLDIEQRQLRTRMDPSGLERAILCLMVGVQRHLGPDDQVRLRVSARGHDIALTLSTTATVGPHLYLYLDLAQSLIGHPIAGSQVIDPHQLELRLSPLTPTPTPLGANWRPVKAATALKLLLVDDRPDTLEAVQRQLDVLGHSVTAVGRPHEALSVFQSAPDHFDMLVTDVLMPVMNGVELARQLQKTALGLPILFISGFTAEVWRQHGVESLDDARVHLLHKPFDLNTLAQAIERAYRSPGPLL
ncbi:MAG: response regulator [Bradymonadia bacterium]